jgi:Spy/CpxP family protein refolding chaperone
MNKSIAFVAVLGLFILGILIGALGMHLIYSQRFPHPPDPHGMGEGMHGRFFFARLERQLDLSAEQKERIGQIMMESREAGRTMHEEMLPQVHELMDWTRESIIEVLTPEQRRKFAQLMGRHRREAERFFLGQGPREGRRQGFKGRRGPQP